MNKSLKVSKIMKTSMHTLRYSAERVERLGGKMELTTEGVLIDLGQRQKIVSWNIVLSALENVIEQTINELSSGTIKIKHAEHREGDEIYCTKCCKRWGVDEDTPECTPVVVS